MVNTKCFNPHTEQLNKINNQIDKLRDEEKVINKDKKERQAQERAWSSVRRSYATNYQVSVFPIRAKYYDFGGRKSNYASQGQAKQAEHFLNNIIPQELEKINKKLNDINLDKHVLISKARQLNTKAVQHEVDCLKEQQKKTKVKLKNSLLRWVDIGVMT
jgi:two-component SAPR family response regulator